MRPGIVERGRCSVVATGIAQDALADGAKLLGRVGEKAVLLVRIGNDFLRSELTALITMVHSLRG